MDADLTHWLLEDTAIYKSQPKKFEWKSNYQVIIIITWFNWTRNRGYIRKYSFDRIDGAIRGAVDIQNKCDCTLIFLDGISQPLNNQQFSNC